MTEQIDVNVKLRKYESLLEQVISKVHNLADDSKLSQNNIFKDRKHQFYIIKLLEGSKEVAKYLNDHGKPSLPNDDFSISARYLQNKILAFKSNENVREDEVSLGVFEAFVSDQIESTSYDGYYWSPQDHRIANQPLKLSVSVKQDIVEATLSNFFDQNSDKDKVFTGSGYFNSQTNKLFLNLYYPTVKTPLESLNMILSTPDKIDNVSGIDMVGTLQAISTRNRKPIISTEVYLTNTETDDNDYKNSTRQLIQRYISLRRYGYRVRTLPVEASKLHVNKGRYPVIDTEHLIGTYYIIRSDKSGGFKLSTLQLNEELQGNCFNKRKFDKDGDLIEPDICTISTEMISTSKLSLRLKSYNTKGFVTSIMYIRWSLDYDTTLLQRYNCLDGMVTVLRNKEIHQSPFIMYKVSESTGRKNIYNDKLIRVEDINNKVQLQKVVESFRKQDEAKRLIEFTQKHYPHLF